MANENKVPRLQENSEPQKIGPPPKGKGNEPRPRPLSPPKKAK